MTLPLRRSFAPLFIVIAHQLLLVFAGTKKDEISHQCDTEGECTSQPHMNYKSILHIDPVEIRRYDDANQHFASEVALLGRPVVVKSAMLREKWKAIGRWSNSYMISAMCPGSILHPVYITRNHTFWLHRSHNEIYHWDEAPRPYEQTNMTVADFFLRLHDPENYGHFYYSEPVSRLTDALAQDVSPNEFLSPFPNQHREITQPIWMGSRGVTTQLHYDTNFNFHVQIDGHKHFVLFPPAAMHKVHMFPRIHPHFRRSQVNLDAVDPVQFPTFTSDLLKDVVEVTLERGDALYIPPFWGHHVTNVDGGVSVNVWTENIEFKSWSADLFKQLLSVPKTVSAGDRLRTFAYFLKFALKNLKYDIKRTIDEYLSQRYRPLRSQTLRSSASLQDKSTFKAIRDAFSQCKSQGTLPEAWKKQLKPKAAQVTEQLLVFQSTSSEDIRKILLFDYLDVSGLSAVQNHHSLVADFFAECF